MISSTANFFFKNLFISCERIHFHPKFTFACFCNCYCGLSGKRDSNWNNWKHGFHILTDKQIVKDISIMFEILVWNLLYIKTVRVDEFHGVFLPIFIFKFWRSIIFFLFWVFRTCIIICLVSSGIKLNWLTWFHFLFSFCWLQRCLCNFRHWQLIIQWNWSIF